MDEHREKYHRGKESLAPEKPEKVSLPIIKRKKAKKK